MSTAERSYKEAAAAEVAIASFKSIKGTPSPINYNLILHAADKCRQDEEIARLFLVSLRSGQPSLWKVRLPSLLIEMVNFDTSFFWPLRASPIQSPVFAMFGNVTAVAVSAIFSVGHLISWCATFTF